jgi:outer membrane protein assembly factor BamB
MHRRTNRMSIRTPAAVLVAALVAWPIVPASAQEMALPAVDDSPSAQLVVEQAGDQAKANPREAVRLLVQALDAGAERLVRAGNDPDLFIPVSRRVHAILRADPALLAAFRRELSPDADAQLARGEFRELVARRLDTDAGLEAALRLAESAIARGRFAAAAAYLDRTADHDLLVGRRALHHASMTAIAAARLGQDAQARDAVARIDALPASGLDPAEIAGARAAAASVPPSASRPAFGPLGVGRFDASPSASAWSETWSVPIDSMAMTRAGGRDEAGRIDSGLPSAASAPAAVGDRVYVDDGIAIRAFDRLSGRPLWSMPAGGTDLSGVAMRMVAASDDAVVEFSTQSGSMARAGSGRVTCIDPATGMPRWETRIDRIDGRNDLDGMVGQGAPIIVDGRVIIAARRTSPRLETVSWLLALDLDQPSPAAWAHVIATTGSARFGSSRLADAPVLAGGVIYFSTSTGAVAAVDPWDGLVRWIRRFPVPVRDLATANEPSDVLTPAVVGGRVFAVSPDRARILALDCRSGALVTEVPTGTDGGVGAPSYLVGDEASGLVLAVGSRVACFAASAPQSIRWSLPASEGRADAVVPGRVQLARTADPQAPVVLMPDFSDIVIRDARDGSERMRLAGAGNSNAILVGNQLLAAGPTSLSGWMPAAEAERIIRGRMAASPSADAAVALVHLARQIRSGPLAAEGAAECVRRVATLPADAPERTELLELLLALDAMDLASGADRNAFDAAVDQAAVLANSPLRGGFARADRALRRRDPVSAARIAVATALDSAGGWVPTRGASISADAEARRIVSVAAAADPRAMDGVQDAVAAAVSKASDGTRARVLRSAARLGIGTRAGADALAAIIAAASGIPARVDAARLVRECGALVPPTPAAQAFLRSLDARWGPALAQNAPPALPRIEGTARRIVEFPGRLPHSLPNAGSIPGGVLTVQGTDLVLRKAPSFAPLWRLPIGTADCTVLATQPSILVCDDGSGGTGAVSCISPEGAVRWKTRSVVAGPSPEAVPDDVADAMEQRPGPSVVPFLTAPVVAMLGRDGSITAFGTDRGQEAWSRPGDGTPPTRWTHEPLAIIVADDVDDGSGPVIRISVIDAVDGRTVRSWSLEGATELRWLHVADGGLLVAGTDVGIEARRLAGGDESVPYWSIDAVDARASMRGWHVGRWLLVLDRSDSLLAIDTWTGRVEPNAFAASAVLAHSPIRQIAVGEGWIAAVRDSYADYFSPDGAHLGRDAPGSERVYVAAAASATRLFILDASGAGGDPVPLRFPILLHDLDVSHGGLESAPPLVVRSLGQRSRDLVVSDGIVAAGNGSVVQAVEFSAVSAPAGR